MIRVPAGLETDFDHTEFCCYEISKLINRIFYRKSDLLGLIFYTRNVYGQNRSHTAGDLIITQKIVDTDTMISFKFTRGVII